MRMSDCLTVNRAESFRIFRGSVERRRPHRVSSICVSSKRASGGAKPKPTTLFDANANEVLGVASRIASMADREIRERYHHLVNKSFEGDLTPMERFEMERIEIRLDDEDRDPEIQANDRKWELERAELLDAIEDLVIRLKR